MTFYGSHTEPTVGERCGYEDSQSELTREELERYTTVQYQGIHLAGDDAKIFMQHFICTYVCILHNYV